MDGCKCQLLNKNPCETQCASTSSCTECCRCVFWYSGMGANFWGNSQQPTTPMVDNKIGTEAEKRLMKFGKRLLHFEKRPLKFEKRPLKFEKRPLKFEKKGLHFEKRPIVYEKKEQETY